MKNYYKILAGELHEKLNTTCKYANECNVYKVHPDKWICKSWLHPACDQYDFLVNKDFQETKAKSKLEIKLE